MKLSSVNGTLLKLSFVLVFLTQNYAQSILSSFDFSKSDITKLPGQLREISGLTTTKEGKLFAHNDEKGIVYEVDFEKGSIVKSFIVGKKLLYEDFEDIATVNNRFFLLASNGTIYEFIEKSDGEYSDFIKYNTPFSSKFDFEGLCFDPQTGSLLIASKKYPGKNYNGSRTVFSFDLDKNQFLIEPRFIIPLNGIKKKYGINNFSPTGIEYNLKSKTFLIISSDQKSIIEVSADGKILNGIILPSADHIQPEGITFNGVGDLLISDEGKNKKGRITRYKVTDK